MTRYWNDSLYLNDNELYHHGVLGMHWGVRRYQNADGSLTNAGRKKMQQATVTNEASNHTWNVESKKSQTLADRSASKKWMNSSTPKKLGALLINHTYTPAYNMQRARGEGKIKSYLKSRINIGSIAGSVVGSMGASMVANMLGGNAAVASSVGSLVGGSVGSYVRSRTSYIKDRQYLNNKK